MALINDLITLKRRLLHFQTEESNNDAFDKWLVRQTLREDDVGDFYEDLVTDLMTELEGLQVEAIEAHQPELRTTVHYSPDFVEEIIQRLDAVVRRDAKLTQPVAELAA